MSTEQVFLATPLIAGRGDVIASPFQFLFTGEDNLRVLIINSLAGVEVTLQWRFLVSGEKVPSPFSKVFRPTADRTLNTFDVPVGVGFLLNASVVVSSGAPLVGQTYVMMQIIRGFTGATLVLGSMLGGYVTSMQHLAFPGSPIQSSIEGGGYFRTITGTNPAPGVEVSETVPAGARWELSRVEVQFVTNATVAGRVPKLAIRALSGLNTALLTPTGTVNASMGPQITFAQGVNAVTDLGGSNMTIALPIPCVMLAGESFGTNTHLFQPGDDYSAPSYTVREWLEAA